MIERQLPWLPVTVENPVPGLPLSVAYEAWHYPDDPESTGIGTVIVEWEYDTKTYDVGTILTQTDQEMRFVVAGSGRTIVIRPTRPSDAAVSSQFDQPYDMPVEVIGAIMHSTIPSDTNLTAAIDGEGDVHTCVLETNMGLYARYGMQWIKLTNTAAIEHLSIVDIAPGDLNVYDDADTSGQMVNITALTPIARPVVEVIEPPPAPPEPVTASAPTRSVIIASVDDLPGAIKYAQSEEGAGSRWYVARRAKAFGYTDPMPWEEGGVTAAFWDSAKHPRGRDGRFIQIGGLLALVGWATDENGNEVEVDGKRGVVQKIDGKNKITVSDPQSGDYWTVKSSQVEMAPEVKGYVYKPFSQPPREVPPTRKLREGEQEGPNLPGIPQREKGDSGGADIYADDDDAVAKRREIDEQNRNRWAKQDEEEADERSAARRREEAAAKLTDSQLDDAIAALHETGEPSVELQELLTEKETRIQMFGQANWKRSQDGKHQVALIKLPSGWSVWTVNEETGNIGHVKNRMSESDARAYRRELARGNEQGGEPEKDDDTWGKWAGTKPDEPEPNPNWEGHEEEKTGMEVLEHSYTPDAIKKLSDAQLAKAIEDLWKSSEGEPSPELRALYTEQARREKATRGE